MYLEAGRGVFWGPQAESEADAEAEADAGTGRFIDWHHSLCMPWMQIWMDVETLVTHTARGALPWETYRGEASRVNSSRVCL